LGREDERSSESAMALGFRGFPQSPRERVQLPEWSLSSQEARNAARTTSDGGHAFSVVQRGVLRKAREARAEGARQWTHESTRLPKP